MKLNVIEIENEIYLVTNPIKNEIYFLKDIPDRIVVDSDFSEKSGFLIIATSNKQIENTLKISESDSKKIREQKLKNINLKENIWIETFKDEYDSKKLLLRNDNEVIIDFITNEK